jgi:predicted Zn-dependent protease
LSNKRAQGHIIKIGVFMSLRVGILSVLCLFLANTATGYGQANPTSAMPAGIATATAGVSSHGSGGGMSVEVTVVDQNMNRLDHQAVVKMYDETMKHATWQPTDKGVGATFDELAVGKYDFEVSATGYLTGRKEVQIDSLRDRKQLKVQIVLQPDPDAINVNGATESLPDKARKEAEKGLSDINTGKFKDAQKHLENASKQAGDSAPASFLLGYVYFLQNDLAQAQTYLTKATTLDAHNIDALNLLGRVHLAQKDYAGAKTTLEQSVAASPQNPAGHSLLASAHFDLGDYKNALAQADLAIAQSKPGASNAQIVRGEALANLGRYEEAIQTLKAYLQAAPDTAAGPGVRQLIATLEERLPNASSSAAQPAKQ